MPGTRTGSRLNVYNKLYYNVSHRKLIKEDKMNEAAIKNKNKGDGSPKIVNFSQRGSPAKIPTADTHTLPGRLMAMPGL